MMKPPMNPVRKAACAIAVLVASLALFAACAESTLDPLPLDITITASRTTAAPGDTVVFVATVQGGSLLGLNVDYGDGAVDSYGTAGARTGKVSFHHAYASPGTFTTKISVTDGVAGVKEASIQIRVN
jgi:hypothetical protein